jgi:hypothetical protein
LLTVTFKTKALKALLHLSLLLLEWMFSVGIKGNHVTKLAVRM